MWEHEPCGGSPAITRLCQPVLYLDHGLLWQVSGILQAAHQSAGSRSSPA